MVQKLWRETHGADGQCVSAVRKLGVTQKEVGSDSERSRK